MKEDNDDQHILDFKRILSDIAKQTKRIADLLENSEKDRNRPIPNRGPG